MSRDVATAGDSSSQTMSGTTMAGNHLSKVPTTTGGKICCVCGTDVAGQRRFKDHEGRYWCYECGLADTIKKHPEKGTPCADCNAKFAPSQLQEFDGAKLCESCLSKRRWSKQRQDNRLHRAAEQDREDREKKKILMFSVITLVVIALLAAFFFM